jgi:hypothetical protein
MRQRDFIASFGVAGLFDHSFHVALKEISELRHGRKFHKSHLAIFDALLQCSILFRGMSHMGHQETPNHVSDDGSFRRRQPWYPHRHEHTTTMSGRTAV